MKKLNFAIIFRLMGFVLVFNGGFMFIDALVSYLYQDGVTGGILLSAALTTLTALIIIVLTHNASKKIKKNEGYLIVTLGWILMALSGSLPFILTGSTPHFSDALFESMSGYTTTGSSVINDIEALPQSILLWRSLTHWMGGMGIIVLAIAILPLLGIGGMQLFMAEAPGLSTDKLHPRITDTAKRLWLIYILITAAETLALRLSGMSIFDAINHSMATVSCGGFSTKNLSVAYWNNKPIIEYIITFFMFLSGTNFILIYYGFKGKVKKVFADDEFKFYALFVLLVIVVTASTIYLRIPQTVTDYHPMVLGKGESSIRHAAFQVLTVVTSTGFITADFTSWTPFLSIVFFGLMFAGGSAGSTSGGVKMVRHYLMIKNGLTELKRAIHHNAIIPVRFNKKVISRDVIYNVMAFFIFYLLTFILGAIVLGAVGGLDVVTSLSTTASSMGNIGPAMGKFNPLENFSSLSNFGKIWCCFLMMIGRLEILTVIILFTPYYWRK